MELVVGALLGALLVVVGGLAIRRRQERIDPVLGTPVPPTLLAPRDRPVHPPGPTPGAGPDGSGGRGDRGPGGQGDVDDLVGGLRAAMADGRLTDEEILRLLPGAEVTREGDDLTVVHQQSTSSTTRIEFDGQVYESIDDVPDPVVREQLRRALGE